MRAPLHRSCAYRSCIRCAAKGMRGATTHIEPICVLLFEKYIRRLRNPRISISRGGPEYCVTSSPYRRTNHTALLFPNDGPVSLRASLSLDYRALARIGRDAFCSYRGSLPFARPRRRPRISGILHVRRNMNGAPTSPLAVGRKDLITHRCRVGMATPRLRLGCKGMYHPSGIGYRQGSYNKIPDGWRRNPISAGNSAARI